MWNSLNGTAVNVITVLCGSLIGLSFASRIPERYRLIVLQCLGLVTLTLGIDAGVLEIGRIIAKYGQGVSHPATYGARLGMTVIVCLLLGAIIGTALKLEQRIENFGQWIHARFSTGDGRSFAQGFLSASVLFCVGPLTLLGCLRNGADGDASYLYVKATLDGFSSIALASSLGAGVLASVITVIVVQGGLSLGALWIVKFLDPVSTGIMTAVGGIALLATGLLLLDIKRIPVANMLPSILLPPFAVMLVERLSPGLLLPHP